jgi:hypothetical protein
MKLLLSCYHEVHGLVIEILMTYNCWSIFCNNLHVTLWKVKSHIGWVDCDGVIWVSSLTLVHYQVRQSLISDFKELRL